MKTETDGTEPGVSVAGGLGPPPPYIRAFLMREFLASNLPDRGIYFIATPYPGGRGFQHFPCKSISEMVEKALELDAQGRNAYFACASYRKESYVDAKGKTRYRTQENAAWVCIFWLDIDVGARKAAEGSGYANVEDANRAVGAFLKATGLPKPTVVSSGGGLHLYWRLTNTIEKEQWIPVAESLKRLTMQSDPPLLVDQSRTTDISSVLRPVGTHNWKPERAGAEVELVRTSAAIEFDEFTRLIETALSRVHGSPDPLMGRPASTLESNLQPEPMRPEEFSAEKIIARCQQFAWARDNQPDVLEPTWRAMIGTLRLTDDPEIVHQFSNQHPKYTAAETEDKARAWQGGGVSCEYVENQRPRGCVGCPHKGKIKSPSALGFKGTEASVAGHAEEPEIPEPQNLFDSAVPTALDLNAALPAVLAEFAAVRAGVAGHDPTAYAYAAVAAVSGVIPHDTRIELGPTWHEPLLQWVAEVGPTGSGKSPAMNAAVEPVIALHHAVQVQYKLDHAAWEVAKIGPPPVRSGYYFTDPTIDALIDRAANATHTVLRHADEGTSWLNAMGRFSTKGDGGERGTWLASWNGAPYTVTRIERGDKSLDAWAVTVLYGITPNKLKEAYADASSDGMLARTLICLTDAARWVQAQHDPNVAAVTARYSQAVHDAAATHQLLPMTRLARARWEALRADYRATAQAVAELAPGLSGFLFKAATMAARLAGLFAVIEGEARVRDVHMEWAEIFMRHAAMTARIAHEQVFAVSQPVAIARRLAARILTSGGNRITKREFERTDAFAKATEPERGAAIEHLAGAGWLLDVDTKRVRMGTRFREATAWLVNPLVHTRFADIAERERQAAQEALARLGRLCGGAAP